MSIVNFLLELVTFLLTGFQPGFQYHPCISFCGASLRSSQKNLPSLTHKVVLPYDTSGHALSDRFGFLHPGSISRYSC